MNLKTQISKEELKQIKKLYKAAFPKSERKPFWLITRMADGIHSEIIYLEEDGEFVGMAVVMLYKELVLLDYFAIVEMHRGKGLGTCGLKKIIEHYANQRFFLEIENTYETDAENLPERILRKHFYEKNDLQETGVQIWLFGVQMELMTYHNAMTYEEYYEMYESLYGARMKGRVSRIGI